jgi:type 1 glutamine amidotransferase
MTADSGSAPASKPKALLLARRDKFHAFEDPLGTRYAAPWLQALGLDLTLTDDRSVLSHERLQRYDLLALLLMPQWEVEAPPEALVAQAQAVAGFANGGGGILALHGATVVPQPESYGAYIDTLGARFRSHPPYQEFLVQIPNPDHPVTRGLQDFRISDELYLHHALASDAEVLAAVMWQESSQPLVWTRRPGRGAVLSIALGHDQASWDHPSFKHIVVEGARWLLGQTSRRAPHG